MSLKPRQMSLDLQTSNFSLRRIGLINIYTDQGMYVFRLIFFLIIFFVLSEDFIAGTEFCKMGGFFSFLFIYYFSQVNHLDVTLTKSIGGLLLGGVKKISSLVWL